MTPPSNLDPKPGEKMEFSARSSHSNSSRPGNRLNSSEGLASGKKMQNSVLSTYSAMSQKSLVKPNRSKSMSSHLSKHRSLEDSGAITDDCDSKCNNHLSSSIHSLCSLYEPSPMSAPDPTTPSAYPPMTPTGTFKKEISGQKQLQQGKDDSKKPLGGDPSRTPVSLGVPHTTPDTARTRGFVGAKISDRVTKFDANPLDGALLSPMQMHASAPSFNIAFPPLAVGGEDEEELPLSPMHVPRSVPSKKRSVRHKKIEIKAQVFDSPTPKNNPNTQVLLSPQEVRELVKSSNTNHRLDQLKYHYEHLSEEESKERRRLAAKIAAKERRRRLGTTTTNSEARRLVWEQSRAKFRNEPSSGPTLLAGLDETNDLGDDVFDEVRAISYDFSDFSPPSFPKTNHQRQLILDAVARDFPFSEFRENGKARTDGAIDALIDAFEPISLQASEVLLHQGVKEGNDRFYILECGIIDVQQEGVSITQVNNTGESFGQIALMYHKPSNVTISVALSSQVQGSKAGARLLRIDQKTYRGLLLEYSQKARKEKKDVLCKVDFLRDLVEEDDFLSNKLASTMVRHEFKADDELGICEDSSFFLVRSGTLRVVSKDGEHDEVMTSGGYFGERSLIGSLSARATCSSEMRFIAQSSGVFFSIDKQTLEQILGRGRLQNLQDIRKLATTALVKKAKLTRTIRDKMASAITELKLDGEKNKIWKIEKTQKPELYVVREGPVLVSYTDEESGKEHKTEMKAGDTFGHEQVKAVSSSDGTKFRRIGGLTTSTVCGKTASISVIPLEDVVSQLGASNKTARPPLPAAANKPKNVPVNKFSVTSQKRVMQDSPAIQLRKKMRDAVQKDLTLDQLEKIRLLGEGEFGEVWMVTADVFQTGVPELRQTFALKTQLRKDDSRGKNATADILREIQLLKDVDHPQVVDLVTTFEDKDAIHILMGLIPGGELWDVIHTEDERGNWRSGMPEGHTKFVTMVLADTLDFIHSRDIVFRDLKPENVMIDADGYPVLVDFGCSKYCLDKTYTFVGTPNYVAPEIITNAGHNRCVDYWALGVTVYEMMTGENPFFFDGMDPVSLYHAICDEKHYPLPEGTSPQLVDFMDHLLEKDPAHRLGMLAKGVDDVFEHPWLEGMDLARIRSKEWVAPWKAAQSEDKVSEDSVLRKMGMCISTPSLDDSMTSRDVSLPDDSTASVAEPSDRDYSIQEEGDNSMGSFLEEDAKLEKSDRKKEKKKKKSVTTKKKKKITDVTAEYQFVTPTTVTYYNMKKPTRNAKEKAESTSRRSALKGALRDLGVDSDEDDDEFQKFLSNK